MANISNLNTTTTDAVFIPENWSPLVLRTREQNFVAVNLFERRDRDCVKGDKVHFPISSIKTATAFTEGNKLEDLLAAETENEKTITVDQDYVSPFLISNRLDIQSQYDQMAEEMWSSGQSIAKVMDTDVLSEITNFTQSEVGTAGSAITNLILTAAKQALDVSDVPMDGRFWIFDPRSEKDLLDLTGNYFTSIDFANDKSLLSGKIARIILGSPVYMTTNLPSGTTGSPASAYRKNVYAHKSAIGVVVQKSPKIEKEYSVNFQGTLGNVSALWGVGTLRPDHGVVINGR